MRFGLIIKTDKKVVIRTKKKEIKVCVVCRLRATLHMTMSGYLGYKAVVPQNKSFA